MRRLALVTLLAAGMAALASAPASAGGHYGHGHYGYDGYHGASYGPVAGGVAAGAAVAGFALGAATGAGAVALGGGYDYTDSYVAALPSNDSYGYAWASRVEPPAYSYPGREVYIIDPAFGVESGWYGY
jgi:hypothetical protein